MSKEFLHILLSAKLALGALAVATPATAASPSSAGVGNANVVAYEVFDAQPEPIAQFGESGDGQGSGNKCC